MRTSDVAKPIAYYREKSERRVAKSRAMTASETIGKIDKNQGWTLLTNGAFSMIDVVSHLLTQTGPARLFITTWVPGNADLVALSDLVESGSITEIKFIVDRGFARCRENGAALLLDLFGADNVSETKNHAKVACIRNENWDYCVRGSLNLNANNLCENIDGDNSAEICDLFESVYRENSVKLQGLNSDGKAVGKAFREMMTDGKKAKRATQKRNNPNNPFLPTGHGPNDMRSISASMRMPRG